MAADQVLQMSKTFYSQLRVKRETVKAKNCTFIDDRRYAKLLEEIDNAKTTTRKASRDYWLLKHFNSILVDGEYKLIYPENSTDTDIMYYVTDSELFQILHDTHLKIGHGGRDRMLKELSKQYKNITRHDVDLYLQLCKQCQVKIKGIKKGIENKSILTSEFNIIDYQSRPDGVYNFILMYEDYLTTYVILRALKTKSPDEIAFNLLNIFTQIGAPKILKSCNDQKFLNEIRNNLRVYWPTLKINRGRSTHSKSHNSYVLSNQNIENMLESWMKDNNSKRWSDGLQFVELMKNRQFRSDINRTPYEALFGSEMIPESSLTKSIPVEAQHQENPVIEISEISNTASNVHDGKIDIQMNTNDELIDITSSNSDSVTSNDKTVNIDVTNKSDHDNLLSRSVAKKIDSNEIIQIEEIQEECDDRTTCEICEKKFKSITALCHHKLVVHNIKKPFVCDLCKKAFKETQSLRRHMWIHMGKRFECDLCGKKFIDKCSLRRHLENMHDDNKSGNNSVNRLITCDMCETDFKSQKKFDLHLEKHGDPNLECDICYKIFDKSSLNIHKRIHTGEKPYVCRLCRMKFTFKDSFHKHQINVHKILEHECNVCGAIFARKSQLNNHTGVHMVNLGNNRLKTISDDERLILKRKVDENMKINKYNSSNNKLNKSPDKPTDHGEIKIAKNSVNSNPDQPQLSLPIQSRSITDMSKTTKPVIQPSVTVPNDVAEISNNKFIAPNAWDDKLRGFIKNDSRSWYKMNVSNSKFQKSVESNENVSKREKVLNEYKAFGQYVAEVLGNLPDANAMLALNKIMLTIMEEKRKAAEEESLIDAELKQIMQEDAKNSLNDNDDDIDITEYYENDD